MTTETQAPPPATPKAQAPQAPQSIGPFKAATSQAAYFKAGILGFAGSGKTHTAALVALGIVDIIRSKKPVMFLDTESGSDFLVPLFKEAGVELMVSKSRSFFDLLAGIRTAEAHGSVLIIDSVTHFWQKAMSDYKAEKNRTKLKFQDWDEIKSRWREFPDLYLNSRVHIIMCGRAGYEYDFYEDEAGDKQLEKTGTKMKVETDMGYEPSLLLEMIRRPIVTDKKQVAGRTSEHVCVVLKDRTRTIQGKEIVNPKFADLEPPFLFLNLGGQHLAIEGQAPDAPKLFGPDDNSWPKEKRAREIACEEIQGELEANFPGQSAEAKKARADLAFEIFGTRSWTAVQEMKSDRLQSKLELLKLAIKEKIAGSAPKAEAPASAPAKKLSEEVPAKKVGKEAR